MKLPSILSMAAVAASLCLTSCETTGDPTQGGLFGWSQSKANVRQAELEDRLDQVDRSNAYQAGRTNALEGELRRKQRAQSSW